MLFEEALSALDYSKIYEMLGLTPFQRPWMLIRM